jgi:hypothetical protein
VQVLVPKSMLDRIDQWAGGFHDMDRSTALRCLLYLGLKRSRPATVIDPKGSRAHHRKRKDAAPKIRVSEKPELHHVLINGASS